MGDTNLLTSTLVLLAEYGKGPSDVRWVGSRDGTYSITWDAFAAISDFVYDSGFGGREVAGDLVVVGDDWWLERGEYDGSEWWEFKKTPKQAEAPIPFDRVTGNYNYSVKDIMEEQ